MVLSFFIQHYQFLQQNRNGIYQQLNFQYLDHLLPQGQRYRQKVNFKSKALFEYRFDNLWFLSRQNGKEDYINTDIYLENKQIKNNCLNQIRKLLKQKDSLQQEQFFKYFNYVIGSNKQITNFYQKHYIHSCSSYIKTAVVFLTVFTNNIIEMILLRLIYGTVIGMNLPISSILMIEVTPKLHRGKIIVALQVLILLGRCWIMILGYIFMESISKGNWRAISLCNSIPCLLCIIGTIFWIQESPRFLILNEEIQKGIDNLNQIGQFNNSQYQMLTDDEIQSLKEWAQLQKQHHQQQEKNSIKQLFNQENLAITWMNYSINFLFMFAMMAIFNILPFILDDENKTLLHLYILDIGEIPAIFVMLYSIDKFGRLSTLLFSTTVLTLILFSTWHWKLYIIITGLAIFKFCCKINCGTLNVLFAESYHTLYRSLGLGTTNAMGGIAGSLAPFVVFPIYFYNYYLPFLICGVFSLFTLILLIFYPIDLTKKPLDQLKQK